MDSLISKFDHDFERFKIAMNFENRLFIYQWLTDFFLLCRRHNDYLFERKSESNAILWKIINEEIRNENTTEIEIILENKNYSRSNQSKNLDFVKIYTFQTWWQNFIWKKWNARRFHLRICFESMKIQEIWIRKNRSRKEFMSFNNE